MASGKQLYIGLGIAGLVGMFLLFYTFDPSKSFYFLPCQFHYVTGLYCPGCGSQRALHQLAHGHFIEALRYNPLMIITLPIILYGMGLQIWNYLFGTEIRFPLFYNKIFIFGFFGLGVVYWVLRNIPQYPFNLLAPAS